ncbi:aspartate--tRNA ligase, mitochondrial-like isoform X2 [Mya arenaria]|uniref:aspartate--tRNA ligase, mitochondrial-like isoform X2 n=1 Tax=Mya arenaria TaxID=6604 RepID=UPI0022E884CE|nr:aspartate--tRNA ligase, mitochondrial-like isoform X2 [Mya arenaria]
MFSRVRKRLINMILIDNTASKYILSLRKYSSQNNPGSVSYTKRTCTCGSLRLSNVGQDVKLCGWLQYRRFNNILVLRDWNGITQVVVPDDKKEIMEKLQTLNYETVLEIKGTVIQRPEGQVNPDMSTGEIEVELNDFSILNTSMADPPIVVRDNLHVTEKQRLEYRYLDLRRQQMQKILRLRSKMIMKMREFLANQHDFVDVETPTLFRRTPGGAKEFVVPSRQKGMFYSLPQSPQQFKQLLMVGGLDRYFQVARCYRDEGTKPERQPEFTQLDIEMSFVDREGVIKLIEDLLVYSWPEDSPPVGIPFPRLTYQQAMRLYGIDKPDTRFGWQIEDVTDAIKNCGNEVLLSRLQNTDSCATLIRIKGFKENISKSTITKQRKKACTMLNDTKTLVYVIRDENREGEKGGGNSLLVKMLNIAEDETVVMAVGSNMAPYEALGRMRLLIADHLESKGFQVRPKDAFNFLWVVDFPLFLPKEDGTGLEAAHHPFTDARPQDRELLFTEPHKVIGQHYDLVLNGSEIGGGSIRICDPAIQRYVIENILKEDSSELEHLLFALGTGCPPHGGIALGLDRLFAILCGTPSIRDVIAFPKSSAGNDLMSGSPAPVKQAELDFYHIQIKKE